MMCKEMLRFMVLILALGVCLPTARAESGEAPEEHIDVWLRNTLGDRITPTSNSGDPYSPRETCGACHHYFTISEGEHFQQGYVKPGSTEEASPLPAAMFPDEMTLAPYDGSAAYDWIAENSSYHPGGGPMEALRSPGGGESVLRISHDEGETLYEGQDNPHFVSRLTPDKKSHFRASGVVEADCLMCHLDGYKLDKRNEQIKARNYRWAATAGAGFGEVNGRVLMALGDEGRWNFSRRPVVEYEWGSPLFTDDGMLAGKVFGRVVTSSACIQCHGPTQAFHTATLHREEDNVHIRAGFQCSDCHTPASEVPGGRLSHRFALSPALPGTTETGVKTCAGCHLGNQYSRDRDGMPEQAPNPLLAHADTFYNASFHLRLLTCTACHTTGQPARGAYLLDISTGRTFWYSADDFAALTVPKAATWPAKETWKPWVAAVDSKTGQGERYAPVSLHTAQWFGERISEDLIRPMDQWLVYRAFKGTKGITVVETRDAAGKKVHRSTVATPEDMKKMLDALRKLGRQNAVFVSDKVYEIKDGKIESSDLPFNPSLNLPVWHNVSPIARKETLGAAGCTDCHDKTSEFFTKMKVRNIGKFLAEDYPVPKKPNATPQMQDWGYKRVPSHE